MISAMASRTTEARLHDTNYMHALLIIYMTLITCMLY